MHRPMHAVLLESDRSVHVHVETVCFLCVHIC